MATVRIKPKQATLRKTKKSKLPTILAVINITLSVVVLLKLYGII